VRPSFETSDSGTLTRPQVHGLEPSRIEELIDAVGRLVTQHSVMAHWSARGDRNSSEFMQALDESVKLSAELQNRSVGLRMTTLSKLFERISDFVMDLSEDKRVALQFDHDGQDVELDTTLVDGLWRPISNLVQTAFDINFDTPEERVKTGKLPSLIMKMSATSENGVVRIVLEDDGRGISENETSLSAGELKAQLEKIRTWLCPIAGTMKVAAQKDKSTCFQISLPESLRLMDVVVVQNADQPFAIPCHVIDEMIDPGMFHTHTLRGDKQFIEYNSKIYPFVTLPELLEKSPPQRMPRVQASLAIERGHVILLRCGREPIALGVEKIAGKQRSVILPLSPHLQAVRGLAGTLMTGRGETVIVVDIVEITDAFWAPKSDKEAA